MPSKTQSNGATPVGKRFELPALDFKFAPLTEGTNIPPPLPSPVEEIPSRSETPAAADDEASRQKSAAESANGHDGSATTASPGSTTKTGTKRPADSPISPVSPTSSANRPNSIRRLFSRNLLNAAYNEGETRQSVGPADSSISLDGRPESRSNFSIMTEGGKRSKRSSGWFRRLRGHGGSEDVSSRRSTMLFDDVKKPIGPPPPMIPELSDLEAKVDVNSDAGFGADLFKNIK